MKLFTIFRNIVRRSFSRPVTRNYPAEVRDPFPGEKGKLIIEADKCIYCGICAKKCPANAITVNRKPDASWQFQRYSCILCGFCVEVCPKKCLHLVPRLEKEDEK